MEDYFNKKVLIIDDDGRARKFLRRILRGIGFEQIEVIDNGEKAVSKIKDQGFELILVDWHMSGVTGLDLVKIIRQDETQKQTQVLMVISEDEQANILEAVKAGINGYITKPFSKHSIHQKIDAVFQNLTTVNCSSIPRVLESPRQQSVSV